MNARGFFLLRFFIMRNTLIFLLFCSLYATMESMELTSTQIIGYLAGIISFANMFRYMWSIHKSGTKPSLTYWILAELAMLLILFSSIALWDTTAIWIALAYASTQIFIIILALRHKHERMTRFDMWLLGLALFSIVIWWYTSNPLYTLIINVGIDAIGYIPLFKKIWKNPKSEDLTYWAIAGGASVLNMFAVLSITFQSVLYPWYLGIVNATVFLVLIRHLLISLWKKGLKIKLPS